jgi:hypothetical protein
VRGRILITVVAWLLGAATATGGCLLAVSLLGAGFGVTGSSSGHQLTTDGVAKALAVAERDTPSAATPSPSARARRLTRRARAARPTPSPTPTPPPTPTTAPAPAQSTTPVGTPFSSQGGTVVATCESAGAHLITWSPAQGYEVDRFVQGPAAVAYVRFETNTLAVTMSITCPNGTPVNSTTTSHDE